MERQSRAESGGGTSTALRDWVRALEATAPIAAQPRRLLCGTSLPKWREPAARLWRSSPRAKAFMTRCRADHTRQPLRALGRAQQLGRGEVVGLMMPNRPGISGDLARADQPLGVVVALLNTQLRDRALAHCPNVVAAKHVIVAADLVEEFRAAAAQLASRPQIWRHGGGGEDSAERHDRAIERFSGAALVAAERGMVTIADRALLIYT